MSLPASPHALTPDQTRRLDAFLSWIRADRGQWPRSAGDWAPLEALMAEGVNVATAKGRKLAITVFHRLAKQAHKVSALGEQERAEAFLALARLTQGRALDVSFSQEWDTLAVSWASVRGEPVFHRGLVEAFLWRRGPRPGPASQEALRGWQLFQFIAVSLDDPQLLERVLAAGPSNLNPLHGMGYGQQRMFDWLVEHHAQALAQPPARRKEGDTNLGLSDSIDAMCVGPMRGLAAQWRVARERCDRLDEALPAAEPGRSGGKGMRL